MKRKNLAAFTLIEMLVVIAIIATIAAFAVPALTSALTKGQMTGTMNNARQLYLAGYQMALDGAANSDGSLQWPGDYSTAPTLQTYAEKLVQNDYLKTSDLPKILSAPGAACSATQGGAPPSITVTLNGASGLKVYPVKDSDGSNVIFALSANYTYNTALPTTPPNSPYGDKGFIVVRKGGDGSVLRKNNATAGSDTTAFEATVGKRPGDAPGVVTPGDPANTMHYP